MAIVCKFSTLAGGVWIDAIAGDAGDIGDFSRCFRFDGSGRAEYAFLIDLIDGNPAPRWYGHQGNLSRDFVLA